MLADLAVFPEIRQIKLTICQVKFPRKKYFRYVQNEILPKKKNKLSSIVKLWSARKHLSVKTRII